MKQLLSIGYVAPHDKVSREVTEDDFKHVHETGKEMHTMCGRPYGCHNSAFAIAHSQVETKDPLRFFVTTVGDCIVNPKITRHTKYEHQRPEGCLSFPLRATTKVGRYNKIEVEFYVFNTVELTKSGKFELVKMDAKLKGIEAQIWQHCIDHLNGVNIWNEYGQEHALSNLIQGTKVINEENTRDEKPSILQSVGSNESTV